MTDVAERIVSVVKCEKTDDSDSVREATLEALNLIGGLESLISPGDIVLLKPNVLCPFDYKTGAVTNPHIVRAMCRLVRAAGARRVIIAESAAVGFDDTMEAFTGSGIAAVAREEKAELVDLLDTPTVCMGIPNGQVFRRLYLPEVYMKANVVINLPVMKTHDIFPATLGLKNMKGLLQQADKKRFHRWGVAQGIVDLNKLVLAQLTVIDGTVAMEGIGPVYGTPVNLGVIVASFEAVAADAVAATIMGIDPMKVEYIKLAAEQGLGCADISQIQVAGCPISDVKRKFKTTRLDFDSYRKQGIVIHEAGACSGCRHFMESMLTLYFKEDMDLLKGHTVVFGQTAKPPDTIEGDLLLFGSCMRKYRNQGTYIAGCPPHTVDIMKVLREKAAKDA